MFNAPQLPAHKTKTVCTIGPASDSPAMLEQMESIEGEEVHCRVLVGEKPRSLKGLNLPGTALLLRSLSPL